MNAVQCEIISMNRKCYWRMQCMVCLWAVGALVFLVHNFPDALTDGEIKEPRVFSTLSWKKVASANLDGRLRAPGNLDEDPKASNKMDGGTKAFSNTDVSLKAPGKLDGGFTVSGNLDKRIRFFRKENISSAGTNNAKSRFNIVARKGRLVSNSSEEYFRLRPTKVNPFRSEFIITNSGFCDKYNPNLLAIVPSIHTHKHIRTAIRSTYGSFRNNTNQNNETQRSSRVLFFFGRGPNEDLDELLRREHKEHGDIVQADFVESYFNLTLKMMVVLKWIATYCGDIDYMLKLDEDVFVNIPLLLNQLQESPYGIEGAVYGYINFASTVRRMGKWAVSREQFPMVTYPQYANGNSYVLSGNIIPRMFMASEYMPYIPIEDAYVSGILAKTVGAKHVPLEGFTYWLEKAPDPCDFVRQKRISATKVTPTLMRKIWTACMAYENVCLNETKNDSSQNQVAYY